MIGNEILSQVILWTIVIMSILIAHEFYKSKDGKLRILIISLFICKIWVYGGFATYNLLIDFGYINSIPAVYIRLILNFPMFIVMLKLWGYIRNREK